MKISRNASVSLTGGQSDVVSEAKWGIAKRSVIVMTNLNAAGGDTVYVSVGQEAAANTGLAILPQETKGFAQDGQYKPSNDTVTAYAAGATTLAVYEEIDEVET